MHNSLHELNRAITASDTTLSNSINAFKQLSFTKFVENVIEEDENADAGVNQSKMPYGGGDVTMMSESLLGDMRSETDKLTDALSIAMDVMQQSKEERREAKQAQDEAQDDGQPTQTDAS